MIVVDRIEGKYAVCEVLGEGEIHYLDVSLSELPPEVKEGDVIVKTPSGYSIDTDATSARKQKILKLQNDLWE